MIGWRAGRLDDVDVLSAYILVDFDVGLPVWERTDRAFPKRYADAGANRGRQFDIRISRENFH